MNKKDKLARKKHRKNRNRIKERITQGLALAGTKPKKTENAGASKEVIKEKPKAAPKKRTAAKKKTAPKTAAKTTVKKTKTAKKKTKADK